MKICYKRLEGKFMHDPLTQLASSIHQTVHGMWGDVEEIIETEKIYSQTRV
jgi:hypothetical protein